MSIVLDKYLSKKMDNIEIKYLDNGLAFIKEYYENTNILQKEFFLNTNARIQGEWKSFYKNGRLKSIYNYDFLYRKDGEYLYFYNDGTSKIKGKYLQEQEEGEWTYYYSNEKLEKEIEYQDGFKIKEIFYHENGNTDKIFLYENKTKFFVKEFYDNENMTIKYTKIFSKDNNTLTETFYNENGIKNKENIYYENTIYPKYLINVKEYYENENIKYEKELEYEVLHGKSTYYFNNKIKNLNENIEKIEYYNNGKRNGLFFLL